MLPPGRILCRLRHDLFELELALTNQLYYQLTASTLSIPDAQATARRRHLFGHSYTASWQMLGQKQYSYTYSLTWCLTPEHSFAWCLRAQPFFGL